jgi:hypothetical protein
MTDVYKFPLLGINSIDHVIIITYKARFTKGTRANNKQQTKKERAKTMPSTEIDILTWIKNKNSKKVVQDY